MKTPYETRQLERIIAAALARRFVGSVNEQQTEAIMQAQAKANDATRDYRMLVEQTVDDILHARR